MLFTHLRYYKLHTYSAEITLLVRLRSSKPGAVGNGISSKKILLKLQFNAVGDDCKCSVLDEIPQSYHTPDTGLISNVGC